MFSITDLSDAFIDSCLVNWKTAITPDKVKGKLIWLYVNRDVPNDALDRACVLAKKLKSTPIVLMLLNDIDDRLNNALCDYLAIQNVSEADQQRYGRHFVDKLQQTEENIRSAFETLKKQRV